MNKEQLKAVRKSLGFNQTEFGIELGFTPKGAQGSVHDLETGKRPIKASYAKLAQHLADRLAAQNKTQAQ